MRSWHRAIPIVVLAAGYAATLITQHQGSTTLARPLDALPAAWRGFESTDITIPDDEQRVAGVSEYLYRSYRNERGEMFLLYVGYYPSQRQGRTIHSPRNCLPGAGWEPLSHHVEQVATTTGPVRVNRYILGNQGARALVYYWYQGRGRVAHSEYWVKWELLRDAALSGRTEEALVRLIVPLPYHRGAASPEVAPEAGKRLAEQVINDWVPLIDTALPEYPR